MISVVVSAIMLSVSFLFPDLVGFLSLFYLPVLWLFFRHRYSTLRCWCAGLVWGLVVFATHLSWFLLLLVRHCRLPVLLSLALYCLIILYCSLTSGVWFVVTGWLARHLHAVVSLVCSSFLYWLFLDYCLLLPLGLGRGYPLLNPAIPLAHYTWFLAFLSFIISPFQFPRKEKMTWRGDVVTYTYLSPVVNKIKNSRASWARDPGGVAQYIYHQLIERVEPGKKQLFVAPESFFPFPLNRCRESIQLWLSALKKGDQMLIGCLYENDDNVYQAVCHLQKGPIINFYVKRHQVPFVEKTPPLWKTITKKIGIPSVCAEKEFSDKTKGVGCGSFYVDKEGRGLRVLPQICSEFFFMCSCFDFCHYQEACQVFLFVNDSWFDRFFRKLLLNLARVKAHLLGMPVVYIGHHGMQVFSPTQKYVNKHMEKEVLAAKRHT